MVIVCLHGGLSVRRLRFLGNPLHLQGFCFIFPLTRRRKPLPTRHSPRQREFFTSISFLVWLFVSIYPNWFPMAARAVNTIPVQQGISTALVGSFRTSRPPVSGNFENNLQETIMNTNFSLSFHNVDFDITDIHGQPWLRGYQIGNALEYSDGAVAIAKLYDRNADEFTDSMT